MWGHCIERQFDKLLLAFLLMLVGCATILLLHWGYTLDNSSWLMNAFSGILGALLTLITGGRMAVRKGDDNGAPTASPPVAAPPAK